MKAVRYEIGSVVGEAATKTEARQVAEVMACKLIREMDVARPVLVEWRGNVSLCYPITFGDHLEWCYTNPRTVRELVADMGRERMGTGGYYGSATECASMALCHMIQIDDGGIPESLPDTLTPKDASLLMSLRANRAV